MKFCRVLANASSEVPEYRALFLFYKTLKKQLKQVPRASSGCGPDCLLSAEGCFVELLVQEVGKLNVFRLESQGRSSSSLAALQARLGASTSGAAKQAVYQALVNFHGECLLLMHWSILAYTAIVKLLKKHQKHTGILVQAPHLRVQLSQASWSTEAVTALIAQAEVCIAQVQQELFGSGAPAATGEGGEGEGEGEVSGPRRVRSFASLDNDALRNTLASLARGGTGDGDSGEESSMGGQGGAASDDNGQDQGSRSSSTGEVPPGEAQLQAPSCSCPQQQQQRQQQQQQGVSEAQSGSQEAEPVVNQALLEQMEVALKTWEQLRCSASTPSTVLRVVSHP